MKTYNSEGVPGGYRWALFHTQVLNSVYTSANIEEPMEGMMGSS